MNEERTLTKKEEVAGGLAVGTAFVTITVLALFSLPPVFHYWDKWADYWDRATLPSMGTVRPDDEMKRSTARYDAYTDCDKRAQAYYDSVVVASTATSTDKDWSSYDCYAVKLEKLPPKTP